jgi:hypothetical protein
VRKFLVTLRGLVLQGNGQITEQGIERLVDQILEQCCQYQNDNHANRLALAGNGSLVVSDEEEHADKADLHHINTSEELVESPRKKQTSSIEPELCHIKCVVPVDDPEESKSENVEDHDQRGYNAVDQP